MSVQASGPSKPSGPGQPDEQHASADQLALFVIDALAPAARRRFERHVNDCAVCTQALAREAAAEQQLQALWPTVERPLAAVLALPLPLPLPLPTEPAPPHALPSPHRSPGAPTATRPSSRPRSSSWNGLAAAAMTLLFLGYWTDAGRSGRAGAAGGFAALEGLLSTEAFCAAGGNSEGPLCASVAVSAFNPSADNLTSITTPSRWACLSTGTDQATCAPGDGARGFPLWAPLCREPTPGLCADPGQP